MRDSPRTVRRLLIAVAAVLAIVAAGLILASRGRDAGRRGGGSEVQGAASGETVDIANGSGAGNADESQGAAASGRRSGRSGNTSSRSFASGEGNGVSESDGTSDSAGVRTPNDSSRRRSPGVDGEGAADDDNSAATGSPGDGAAAEDLTPEAENLDRIDVRMRNDYPPRGDPTVSVEYLSGGGIRVTVQSPGVNSMNVSQGLSFAQKAVRAANLSNEQLARVQQYEKGFVAGLDARTADVYGPVETIAAALSQAIAENQQTDLRNGTRRLSQQMSAIGNRWQAIYEEYVDGVASLLTAEQADAVRSTLLPRR